MAMSLTTLENELKAMPLFGNEPDAINAWATVFANYFQGVSPPTDSAISNAVPIAPAAIPAAKAAMISELSGMSGAGQGAAKIQAGIVAFWGALIPAIAWPTTTVITPPPGLSGIAAALGSVFTTNKDTNATKDAAMTAIAGAIHPNNLGGTATWPVPIGPMPIT